MGAVVYRCPKTGLRHGQGAVVTGWNYRDGSGGTPIQQFCYYTAPNVDRSSKRVDIASNGVRSVNASAELVPDLGTRKSTSQTKNQLA